MHAYVFLTLNIKQFNIFRVILYDHVCNLQDFWLVIKTPAGRLEKHFSSSFLHRIKNIILESSLTP